MHGYGRRRWRHHGPTRRSTRKAEAARGAVERLSVGTLKTACVGESWSSTTMVASALLRPSCGVCALIRTLMVATAVPGSTRRRRRHPNPHTTDGVLYPCIHHGGMRSRRWRGRTWLRGGGGRHRRGGSGGPDWQLGGGGADALEARPHLMSFLILSLISSIRFFLGFPLRPICVWMGKVRLIFGDCCGHQQKKQQIYFDLELVSILFDYFCLR